MNTTTITPFPPATNAMVAALAGVLHTPGEPAVLYSDTSIDGGSGSTGGGISEGGSEAGGGAITAAGGGTGTPVDDIGGGGDGGTGGIDPAENWSFR